MPMGAFHTSGAAAQVSLELCGARAGGDTDRGGFVATQYFIIRRAAHKTVHLHPHYMLYVTIAAFCYDTRTRRRAPRCTLSGDSLRAAPAHAV